MIEFQCKRCKSTISAPDTCEGKRAKCPKCGEVSLVLPDVLAYDELVSAEDSKRPLATDYRGRLMRSGPHTDVQEEEPETRRGGNTRMSEGNMRWMRGMTNALRVLFGGIFVFFLIVAGFILGDSSTGSLGERIRMALLCVLASGGVCYPGYKVALRMIRSCIG